CWARQCGENLKLNYVGANYLDWVFPGDLGVPKTLAPTRYNEFGPGVRLAHSPGFSNGALEQTDVGFPVRRCLTALPEKGRTRCKMFSFRPDQAGWFALAT